MNRYAKVKGLFGLLCSSHKFEQGLHFLLSDPLYVNVLFNVGKTWGNEGVRLPPVLARTEILLF